VRKGCARCNESAHHPGARVNRAFWRRSECRRRTLHGTLLAGVGGLEAVVFEAGIANLTRDETPILVHYGTDDTQQFTLVRVEQPKRDPGRE
jgi:hypothetical protein